MSAFLKATFAEVAPLLAAAGYHPVPIRPGQKAPLVRGWQRPQPPGHYLAHHDPDTGRITDCERWFTGILTANCPAVDLDIRDREIVRSLIALADEVLGPAPFRVGSPPKALIPYSAAAPFKKLASRWWALSGEHWRAPGYVPHRIEILCDHQQFLSYARHPRGTFYRWRRGEPVAIPREDLPEIDQDAAETFVAAAEAVLEAVGAVPVRNVEGKWTPLLTPPEAPQQPPRRTDGGNCPPRGWQLLEPQALAKKIDPKHARSTRDGWICSCPAHMSTGHRSLSIMPRDGGGSIVHCFSECRFVDIARAISSIVGDG